MSPSWTRACGVRLIGSDVRIIAAVPSAIDGGVRKTCRLSLARRRQRYLSRTASVEKRQGLREAARLEALREAPEGAPELLAEGRAPGRATSSNQPSERPQPRHSRLDQVCR